MILIDVYNQEQKMILMYFMQHLKVKINLKKKNLKNNIFQFIEWREEQIAKINATKQGAGK